MIFTAGQSSGNSVPKRRRIVILPTDSDSESDSNSTVQSENNSNPSNFVVVTNGFRRSMKTPSILEKERQMKFLLDMFPHLEAMVRVE